MRLLVVGGAGYLGRLVLPYISQHHEVRVFDLVKPEVGPWEYVIGDIADVPLLASCMNEIDVMVYMAKYIRPHVDDPRAINILNIKSANTGFDVHVKGLYGALWAAADRAVRHVVYISSLSVYKPREDHYPDESFEPDATDLYGLTKRMGEDTCRCWVPPNGPLTVTALRLCFPVSDDALPPRENIFKATTFTRASDTARAILAAVQYRAGFEAFSISGDAEDKMVSLDKARSLLGWSPIKSGNYK